MEQLLFNIAIEELSHPAATKQVTGHIDQQNFVVGAHEFKLPQGIDYDLMLTHTGEGILATGMVQASLVGTCDKCLEEAVLDISAELDEYYLFDAPEVSEEDEDSDDEIEYLPVIENTYIDLAEPIAVALVMEVPFIVVCKEDCKGLCPRCGINLNEESCSCIEELEQEKINESPFAQLADLKLDK